MVERLAAHLIDYAGTFPPANLPPEAALTEWKRHLAAPERRLVRALCWPARDLERLKTWDGPPCDVTAIGAKVPDWDAERERDAAALTAFAKDLPERISLAAYECGLPDDRETAKALDSLSGFGGVGVYVEVPDAEPLGEIAERDWASAKFRTLGATPETLAAFLHACAGLELPFKLTAGLHAPLTTGNSFGFLNVLAATALAVADELNPREIAAILTDERGMWRAIEIEEAEDARGLFEAIGSCSVADIAEGLKACS